ncbi:MULTISPECIES: bleomycin resistance protein [Actinomyces]|uniref:Bleomycin resistance protein n=1 Tax=Actinomyces respiraculi TaxID=2744574 RepID=A0A7T0PWI6_9ACTO|nr:MULTISPECIES: VOC family protein [Actinomyces]QPL05769.1 VOC family protein [Actinomyces respiraculi]
MSVEPTHEDADVPALVPELSVRDLDASLEFWCCLIGFTIRYTRREEGFAYLALGRAHVMLDTLSIERSWLTGSPEPPLGRGINLEIWVPDLEVVLGRLASSGWPLFLEPEEVWYRADDVLLGVRQFLVQDPDGYLLRLQTDLGRRPA